MGSGIENKKRKKRHRNRRRSSKTNGRGNGRSTDGIKRIFNRRNLIIALVVLAIAVIVVAVFLIRNLVFYITGNDVTDDNKYPVKGVDVSSYQLEIDWDGLEDEGFEFAYIKATEGTTNVDSRFEFNWAEARKTGMRVGAYHFLSYSSSGDTQAQNFIDTVGKKRGMLPPAVDVEFYGKYTEKNTSSDKIHETLDDFLELIEGKYKVKPVIYTNSYFYSKYIAGYYDDYPIWISADSIINNLPDGRDWTFCQYSFYGTSDNIAEGEKYVDMDVFNGSSWDFRKFDGK